jgi:hypothetical protein
VRVRCTRHASVACTLTVYNSAHRLSLLLLRGALNQAVDVCVRCARHVGALERHWGHYRRAVASGDNARAAQLEGILLRTILRQVSHSIKYF